MAHAESPWAGEEWTAEGLINSAAVEDGRAPDAFISTLQERKEMLEAAERAKIDQYIIGIRPAIEGVLVEPLEVGVGGEYDGSKITIAQSSLLVHSSIQETIDQARETRDHEEYHQENDHTAAMVAGSSAHGDVIVTIGGHAFTETSLIEGVTVARTGQEFVSEEYVQFAGEVHQAIAAAGISLEQVEHAISDKYLQSIDDVDREGEPEETHHALAA